MENFKQFKKNLEAKMLSVAASGDVFQVNEMASNMLLGFVLMVLTALGIICLVLNEVGIFTADKSHMRLAILLAVLIQSPVIALNKYHHGEPKWMKNLLEVALLLVCALMSCILGHNVTLIMVIPALLSVRYCDVKFTRRVTYLSIVVFLIACVGSAYLGIINLNMYKVDPGTSIFVSDSLRNAIIGVGMEKGKYIQSLIINDYIPKLLIFSVIGFSCIKIAERGRNLTDLQNEVTAKSARIETELNLATEIQAGMLPCIFPAFPDHGELELFASNTPAKEVGGDFYDYFRIDDDHIAIVMADVSGKGVGAALFMTISKIVIKNQMMTLKSVSKALTEANRQLCENNEASLFVTVWAGIYEISTGKLCYTNAGHNPPLVYRKGGKCEYLKGINGLFLAGLDCTQYTESEITLSSGDEIFLYTDGVTEATRSDNKLYGDDRLAECLNKIVEESVKGQISKVLEDIEVFVEGAEQFDDITMMGMKIQ